MIQTSAHPLWEKLGKVPLFIDGAMGTLLQENGLGAGDIPELWNLSHPEVLYQIHSDYLKAGCDILKANTFGANRIKLHGMADTEEVIRAAVSIAKKAASDCGRPALVAMDIGPTGKLLKPMGELPFDEAAAAFGEAARIGQESGADLILIETMSDTLEMKAAVIGCKENSTLPVFASMIFDEKGKLLTGGDIAAAAALLTQLGVDAIGINCGLGPEQMVKLLPTLRAHTDLPLFVNPNAGLPRRMGGKTVYDVFPPRFAACMADLIREGAWVVGGCCGTTPAHIREMVRVCSSLPLSPLPQNNETIVSSYAKTVSFGAVPLLIGERINPTGKKKLKQALRDHDIDYLLREAVTQQENGADILDVNVGLPEIDEKATMCEVIDQLQSVTDLPLQIDTSSPEVMEAALRRYNGVALVNSVNGKEEVMHAIFPLVKKYGGVVIALTLDEEGIPETAEGRLRIAEKILKTADSYGIPRKNLVVDALTMTISTGKEAANVTLETISRLHKQGIYTSLGVSNVSFGLPQREIINSMFFTMALQNGLSAAIMNPNSAGMMNAYRSYLALTGLDENCSRYIAHYSAVPTAAPAPANAPGKEISLAQSIIRGLKESAYAAAAADVKEKPALDVIREELVPALDTVGKDYETGKLYLPQLLMSAEAAKAAFEALKNAMQASGDTAQVEKGTIVLATVQGDIHDIGKNIVKVLLQNYSFHVLDLGKDVPPQTVVDAVVQNHVQLCGLSALMTTTVENMARTIELLHEQAPWCKIVVGGAVLNAEYAAMIHADHYAKDAMETVRYAETIFS